MSDPYSFSGVTPTGLSALAQQLQSVLPTVGTAPPTNTLPDAASPPPPDPSGRGGFLSGLNIPAPPTGVPSWITGLPSTLADLVRRGVEPPASWFEQNYDEQGRPIQPNEPFATGPGVEYPPTTQPPPTVGKGGQPGQPSPMQAPEQPEFPPGREPDKKPPDTSQPIPEPKKAPPPTGPSYIPSRRDTPPGAWGKADLVEQGMANYPGLLPPPYGPQPHEWRGIFQGASRFLGNMGSGVVAPLAQSLMQLDPAYWQAKQRGETHKAQMAASQFALAAKQLAMKQAQESRDYGDAFAAYGPHTDAKGKTVPGDPEALEQAIREIAGKYHDRRIPAVLDRAGLPAVERLIRERDAHGKDASKVLIQIQKELAIRKLRLDIAEKERKAKNAQIVEESGLAPADSEPGAPTDAGHADTHELDQYVRSVDPEKYKSEDDTTDTNDTNDTSDDTKDTSETEDTPASQTQTETQDPTQRAATSETPAAPTGEAAGAPEAPAPARPVRLAMADTGTVSDAPRPGELRTPEAPRAPAATPTREAAAAAPAPAAGTPEAMGATAPVPSLRPRKPTPTGAVPMEQAIPGQEQPATAGGPAVAAPAPYEFKPSTAVMDAAAKIRMTDSEGRSRKVDLPGIETLALQMANHTVRIQDLRQYSDWYKQLARRRGDEIIRDMIRLGSDPNIPPDRVIPELAKFNPEFAAQVKAMAEGRSKLPTSQWTNPGYRNRAILLGSKINPGFNEGTAHTIFKTYDAFTTGRQSDWVTAVGTTYGHGIQLEEDLRKYPGLVARVMSGTFAADLFATPQEQETMARIKAELNTFNAEFEYAVSRGRPTVWARREQADQAPLVFGNQRTLLANIEAKKALLRTRYGELAAQFRAGTGQQPDALRKRMEEIGMEGSEGVAAIDRDRRAGARHAPAGPGSPMATPEGIRGLDAPVGDAGNVVDYKTYFGVQ